jgi:hypothetical protein
MTLDRIVGEILVLLLAIPALRAAGQPKDKPTTPAEQYKALLKEDQTWLKAYWDALRTAKTEGEKQTIAREKYPNTELALKFAALAEKNPKDPVAVDALIWVLTHTEPHPDTKEARTKAIALLVRDHIQGENVSRICQSLQFTTGKESEAFLRTVLAKNKNKGAQAEACLALAQILWLRAEVARHIQADPEGLVAKKVELFAGKDEVEQRKKIDLAKVKAEIEKVFKELAEQHTDQLKAERLETLCDLLSSGAKGSDALLRSLLEKDARREVQGVACLMLARVLARRADALPAGDAKAAKMRDESEKLFERATDTYADVKLSSGRTVGGEATSELFELRHLSVGKPAPNVEGVDQDGKKFKLSDYKGKVVLLDFWADF